MKQKGTLLEPQFILVMCSVAWGLLLIWLLATVFEAGIERSKLRETHKDVT